MTQNLDYYYSLEYFKPISMELLIMRIWTEICLEPGVQRLNGKYTIVLYLSEKKNVLKAKTRSGVVKSLLNSGLQVFGACAPVNDLVVQTIKNLDGKKLSQNIIDRLERKNKKYSPFKFSRDYQLIMKWLTFELEGKRIEKSTFRREIRAKRLV